MDENIKLDKLKELVDKANYYRDQYYNHDKSLISDEEYDDLFDEIENLEKEIGVVFSNSPTHNVGYTVSGKLKKVKHNHPMLSLGKTKDLEEIKSFLGDKKGVIMGKLDGLSLSVAYKNGKLVSAETRGNGEIGEDVLHNAYFIENFPIQIPEKEEVVVDGELIIPIDEFEKINEGLEEKYKHVRNLASGSIRQLDSRIAASRHMHFVAWKLIKAPGDFKNSFIKQWFYMDKLGFETVPLMELPENISVERLEQAVNLIKTACKAYQYKIDGCVFGYDDIEYSENLGRTEHHLNGQIAYKFYDEKYSTTIRQVVWQMGRSGILSPVAVFDPVEIDGSVVTRATLHNISYIKMLGLKIGCTAYIIKANDVIPRVDSCEDDGTEEVEIPTRCPDCGSELDLINEQGVALICRNRDCPAQVSSKFIHFVSRDCMNIEGLSEATLIKFIERGFLRIYADIFCLSRYAEEIKAMDGFGEKSWDNLWSAIQKAKTVTLSHYINALGIPLVGKRAAKAISEFCDGNLEKFLICKSNKNFDWDVIPDFGEETKKAINEFNDDLTIGIEYFLNIIPDDIGKGNKFTGKIFCVTGKLENYTREEITREIEDQGGKVASSVTSKTDYLITNTPDSNSSKNKKAKELGIEVITEYEFINMIGG